MTEKLLKLTKKNCNDGSDWKCKTLKGNKGNMNQQLVDWANDRGFKWNGYKDKFSNVGQTLIDNYAKNEEAKAKRAENANLNATNNTWNTGTGPNQRLGLMQAAANTANAAGDKLYTKNKALNDWSRAAVDWAKATPSGKYMQNREKILNTNPGGQSEYLVSLEENGVITGAERETLLFGGPIGSTLDPSGNVKGNGGLIGSLSYLLCKRKSNTLG